MTCDFWNFLNMYVAYLIWMPCWRCYSQRQCVVWNLRQINTWLLSEFSASHFTTLKNVWLNTSCNSGIVHILPMSHSKTVLLEMRKTHALFSAPVLLKVMIKYGIPIEMNMNIEEMGLCRGELVSAIFFDRDALMVLFGFTVTCWNWHSFCLLKPAKYLLINIKCCLCPW